MNRDRWPGIKEVFHGALARPPGERAAYLDETCAGDEPLRAEVQRLLHAHAHAGSFIEESPVFGVAGSSLMSASLTGQILGHYHVGRRIGVGGMGEVYAAFDSELRRDVALKVVAGGNPDAEARLRREAQHASQLNHPHICTIHEVGSTDGQAFIVMEYVEGRPLSELIADEGLPTDTMLRYAIQIADALAHAHRQGVIHRDLKSANIVVTPDHRAKVLDFGLARDLLPERAEALAQSRASLAEEGEIAGTLPYMSPELLCGKTADARSDIWAFGVVLYEMATGLRPFRGSTGFELSAAILHLPPAPLPPRVPEPLQTTIKQCLVKERGDRYHSADDVRAALEGVQETLVNSAPAAPRLNGTSRVIVVRSRAALLVLAGAIAVTLAGAAVVRWARSSDPAVAVSAAGPPAIAVMYFDNVAGGGDTAWLTKGVPSMLLTSLAQTRGLPIVSTQRLHEAVKQLGEVSLDGLAMEQVPDVARRAGAGAVVVGSIMKSGSEIRIDAQLEDLSSGRVLLAASVRGTDPFSLVDQLAARIRDGIGLQNAADIRRVSDVSSASLEAYRLYSEGLQAALNFRLENAHKALEQAVAIDPSFAQAYLQLASVSEYQDLPAARTEYLRQATEHSDRLSERERLLAEVEWARETGDFAASARLLDELIARFPDFENAYFVTLYEPVRGALYDPGKYVALSAAGVKALPMSGSIRNMYGYALLSVGRHADALREFETYRRLAVREPNPYDSMGEAYLMMGLPDKALEYYAQALAVDPTFPSHEGRVWGLAMLGRYDEAIAENVSSVATKAFVLSRAGRYRDARNVLTAGIRQAENNRNRAQQGEMHLLSSLLAVERSEYGRAIQEIRAAAQCFAELAGELKRVNLILLDFVSGLAEVRAGRPARARPYLESERLRYRPEMAAERWWLGALQGDIALADGRVEDAAAAYAAGEPSERMWASLVRVPVASVLANNLPSRDGLARVMKARGDLAGAIQEYRRLTTAGTGQKWMAMLEPRYVLEIGRLLDQTGDKGAARKEYERFLELWKHADPDLPELAEARRAVERLR